MNTQETAQTAQQEISLIGKLSMKTIKVRASKHATDTGFPIARVYGEAHGIKIVEDKINGDVHEALSGDFEAENLETHELFRSGVLYLPAGIHDMVASAVKGLHVEGESVKFALEIRAVIASNKAGYSYEAKNLLKAAIVDPLAEMRRSFGIPASASAPAALPTPEKSDLQTVSEAVNPKPAAAPAKSAPAKK